MGTNFWLRKALKLKYLCTDLIFVRRKNDTWIPRPPVHPEISIDYTIRQQMRTKRRPLKRSQETKQNRSLRETTVSR